MSKRNSPNDIKEIDDLNRLNDIVKDKRNAKRAADKKTRRDRHYEKQFIKNTLKSNIIINPQMNRKEIIEKLMLIVKPFVKNNDAFKNLTENTDFIKDLEINSANLVDIILDIEDVFGIVIDNDDMTKMIDVKNTIEIIETKLSCK